MKNARQRLKQIISFSLTASMFMTSINVIPAKADQAVSENNQCMQMQQFNESELGEYDQDYEENEILTEEEMNRDTDGDNLCDVYEMIFETDPENPDTDGDGLNDYLEIKLALNPLEKDSDNDGIQDLFEDSDRDGLDNFTELKLGTDLSKADTDGDGLRDGEEVNKYNTSPLLEDSDNDGLSDGDEVKLELDPNNAYSDEVTIDSVKKIEQQLSSESISQELLDEYNKLIPSLSGEVSGVLDKKVFLEAYTEKPLENNEAVIGGIVKVNISEECNDKLNLKYDYKNINTDEIDSLTVCKYEEGKIIPIDTVKDEEKGILSAEVLEEGIYCVINSANNEEEFDEFEIFSEDICEYNSNPALEDTDFDGINDDKDSQPTNNSFSMKLKTPLSTSSVSYTMDYRDFFKGNNKYNKNLSTISILYSTLAYDSNSCDGMKMQGFMEKHGLKNVVAYDLKNLYSDSDVCKAYIGHRKVTYNGETKEIISIFVKGTDANIKEWESNFDIGNTNAKNNFKDWTIANNHKGFDVASTRILKCLSEYESKGYLDSSAKKTYWIAGHSRGAGIANILGARLIDQSKEVYDYTFAAPSTTTSTNAESYVGIYNIVNTDDLIPYLPMSVWGFRKYGKTYKGSIAESYEKEWEDLTGKFDYDPDTLGMDKTIEEFGNIIDKRNDAYNGNLSDITVRNYGTSKSSREEAIAKIPSNALKYCVITRYNGKLCFGWDFTVRQQPEYFMQLLAAFLAGEINAFRFAVELDTAKRYKAAKLAIIRSGIGGLEHPHYYESYYVLSKHIN